MEYASAKREAIKRVLVLTVRSIYLDNRLNVLKENAS